MMPNDNAEVVRQHQNGDRVDQVKTHEEIEGNKNKLSTYLVRTVNCSCSKILKT